MPKKVSFLRKLDFFLFGNLVNLAFPEFYRPKYTYAKYYRVFFYNVIPQKIFRLNGNVKWPVHFTSTILSEQNITKGIICDPGDNPNVYVEASNGIQIGSNVGFGTGVKILSSLHHHDNHSVYVKAAPIIIGDHVFVGANSVILPSVKIGDNVVIGAGSIVTKDIPSNSIAVGNPCKVIKTKNPYKEDFTKITFNKRIPKKFHKFINGNK